MRNLILFLILSSPISCTRKETSKKELEPYIISQAEIENQKKELPLPPIPLIYGSDNFIIDTESNIFYFHEDWVGEYCATGVNPETPAVFINLRPEELIKIHKDSIANFIPSTLKPNVRNFVHISSQSDTIKSEAGLTLIDVAYKSLQKMDRDICCIRRARQEEDSVLAYKKSNKPYNPYRIKWDKNRILFPKTD